MIASILLAFVAQGHATEAKATESQDQLVDKSLDELFERALRVAASNADLDDATMGKPAGAAVMGNRAAPLPMAQPLGRRDAALATLGALVASTLVNPAQALNTISLQIDEKKQAEWKEGIVRRDDAMAPGNMVKGKDITEVPNVYLRSLNQRYDPSVVKYKDTFTKATVDKSLLPGFKDPKKK